VPTTTDMSGLNCPDLRERNSDVPRPLGIDFNPIEGGFVGVEGDQGGGCIRHRRSPRIEQDYLPKTDVDLGHSMVRVRQDPTVVV